MKPRVSSLSTEFTYSGFGLQTRSRRQRLSDRDGCETGHHDEWLHTKNVDAARAMLQLFPADEMAAEPAPK
ncbi:hypothetical protein WM15_32390 [Burkholderia ubonensis]|nr:hypothetical protein [Burkholderia ubonensis]KWK74154.1 hypothetical protein WM15_32390 [Burkholderia ubonensis]